MPANKLKTYHGEKIFFQVRKHWFIMLVEGLFLSALALLPLIAIFILQTQMSLTISPQVFWLGGFFYASWLILMWLLFWLAWTDNYLDVWLVTDQRIIGIEQKGIFNREVSSLRFDRIQDITVSVEGFLPTLLSFGDIHVQTAGATVEIIFKNAARPYVAKESINRLHGRALSRQDKSPAE
ncbi:MAG: PH domain-containing protein [Candidatus Paceibacterota bacterium]